MVAPVTVYTGYSAITAEVAREEASATPRQAQAQGVVGTEALPRQLPEGWEMRRSKSTSKVYYVNEKLGEDAVGASSRCSLSSFAAPPLFFVASVFLSHRKVSHTR